jgi:hypothetical protein
VRAPTTRLPTLEAGAAAAPRTATSALEPCSPQDRFHDYVLGAYEPLAPPEGKLRSVNLLVESFAVAGLEARGLDVVRRVREGYGPFRTVWGIKWNRASEALAWELYFYDFERAHTSCSLPNLRAILAPVLAVDAEEPWPLPWHMFSIEFARAELEARAPAPAHVYVDMRSYELSGKALRFENVYTFHDPRVDVDEVLHRLRSSLHFDAHAHDLAAILPPRLFRCGRLCVANKRASDAVYFSRIPTGALQWFMDRHAWPEPLRRLIASAPERWSHLLWDVGTDFRSEGGGAPQVWKTGIYGSF